MSLGDTTYIKPFIMDSAFLHDEIPASRLGVSGELVPFSMAGDSIVEVTLILCTVISMITLVRSWRFICFQTKNLFRMPRENSMEMRETSDEMRYQSYFCLQGIILLGILSYSTAMHFLGENFIVGHYEMVAIMCGIFAGYYIIRELLAFIVQYVFFEKQQVHLCYISRLYFTSVQGALLLPLTLLHIYFQLHPETMLRMLFLSFGIPLLLYFYKIYNIFFRKNNAILQFFLYLCTLEVVPLILLTGILSVVTIYLTRNI